VGALQFLPDGAEPGPAGAVEGRPVDEDYIARKIGDLTATPLGVDEDEEFRISLAGAQEKTALLFWKEKWHLPHGTTATTHILPQIGMLPSSIDFTRSVENEYLPQTHSSVRFAQRPGVAIADFKATVSSWWHPTGSDAQCAAARLPQEDCCQAFRAPTANTSRMAVPAWPRF
jgi:serine/threonine-protein kinase HipA